MSAFEEQWSKGNFPGWMVRIKHPYYTILIFLWVGFMEHIQFVSKASLIQQLTPLNSHHLTKTDSISNSYLWFPQQKIYYILYIWIAMIYNHVIITNSEFCFLSFAERCKQCLSSFWSPSWLVCLFISRGTCMVIKVENKTES